MARSIAHLRCLTAGCFLAVCALAATAQAQPYPTTYGQDPIPPTRRFDRRPVPLGYGVDPIPVKSLRERMYDWHNNIPDNSVTVQTYPPVRPRPKTSTQNRTPWDSSMSAPPLQPAVPRSSARPSSRRTSQRPVAQAPR